MEKLDIGNNHTDRKAWAKAGGNPDEYVKETLPTFGVIGALLLTVSIPMTLSPISFAFGDPADDITSESVFVQLYAIFLNLSTGLSLAMIILSMGVYQQYVNAYSSDLRVAFAAKFGYVVAVFTNCLVGDILSLLAAIFIGVIKTYSTVSAIIGIVLVGLPSLLAAVLYIYMSLWNSNNYAKQMVIDIKAKLEEEAKQKKEAEQISKIGDVEMQKLIDSSKEMQKLFGTFASSFELIMKQQQSTSTK